MAFLQAAGAKYSNTLFIDVDHLHEIASNGVSLLNGGEAQLVALLLANMCNRGINADQIGVITFYNGQKEELKRNIDRHECMKKFSSVR